MTTPTPQDRLLSTAEVARMFGVHPRTVTNWAKDGRLNAARTLGGHRRFKESEVIAAIAAIAGGDQ